MKKEFEKWWDRVEIGSIIFSVGQLNEAKAVAFKAWKKATELERENNPNYKKKSMDETPWWERFDLSEEKRKDV